MGKSEEALKSDDVALIKRCRSSMATQITADLLMLNRELNKKVNESFDLPSINDQVVQSKRKHLSEHFELILKLHERFVELRAEGVTEAEEQDLIQADITFIDAIEMKVYATKDVLSKYDDALKASIKSKSLQDSLGQTKLSFKDAKDRFNMISDKIKKECFELIEKAEGTNIKDIFLPHSL